eukprot:6616938-Alexandrium_andersonii.AAC.1
MAAPWLGRLAHAILREASGPASDPLRMPRTQSRLSRSAMQLKESTELAPESESLSDSCANLPFTRSRWHSATLTPKSG